MEISYQYSNEKITICENDYQNNRIVIESK